MQTQQVNGISGGLFYTAKSPAAKSSDNSFDQLIQMSQNMGAANEKVAKPAETAKKEPVEKLQKSDKPSESVKEEKMDMADKATKQPDAQKTNETQKVSDVDAAEKVAGVVNQVTEQVKETLNLTDEQLMMLLEQMGLTPMDLLNPENLQNLVLMANNGQDAVMLLTDSNLLNQVKELTEQVQNILQENGMTAQDLAGALEDADFGELVAEAMEQLNNKVSEADANQNQMQETESTTGVEIQMKRPGQAEHADAKGDRNSDFQNNQMANQFVQNLQQAAEQLGEITGQTDMVQMIREIADQIMEKVKISVTADTTSLEITLTPEELGKVNLTVTEQDGMLKASFVTENELAKEAIESNLIQFKEMLNEQGLKVDSIEVMVGGFTFDKNGEAGQSGQEEKKNGHRQFIDDEELTGKEETDQLARHFMEGGESTVNYMA